MQKGSANRPKARKKTTSKGAGRSKSKKVISRTPNIKNEGVAKEVKLKDYLKEFDAVIERKDWNTAEEMLETLRGVKKWQHLNLRSVLEFKRGNPPLAEDLMRQALREPDVSVVINRNLAGLLVNQGRMAEAIHFAKIAYEANKEDLKGIQLYMNCLLDLGKAEEVLKIGPEVLKLYPEDKILCVSQASALRSAMKNDEAAVEIEKLLEKFPDEPVVHRLKADLLGDTNSTAAVPYYDRAIQLSIEKRGEPDPAVQWNMSLHLLRIRRLEEGWECWEQGFHPIVGTMGRNLPPRIKNLTRADDGREIDQDAWTLVVCEQGIGDQVLFMNVMREAIQEFKKILLITEPRFSPILRRSFPEMEVGYNGLTFDWEKTKTLKKNGYIPLGSLPRRYRKTVADYDKNKAPFLIANKSKFELYRSELKKHAAGRPIIGISWKGGYWAIQRKTKALQIQNWEPIFNKKALYVNLQYGDISEELKYLESQGHKLVVYQKLDFKEHLDDWLAIAAACDGIISVSTALVHFAGAIGQKVAIVMPEPSGPWHLGIEDKESMIYKNVKIYRREREESLESLIKRVANIIVT